MNAKLTREQVDEIRAAYIPFVVTVRELATRYGVAKTTVADIVKDKTWKAA